VSLLDLEAEKGKGEEGKMSRKKKKFRLTVD